MGFFLNPTQAVVSSGITPILAGRLANVLRAMKECDDITGAHFATLTLDVPTIYKGHLHRPYELRTPTKGDSKLAYYTPESYNCMSQYLIRALL